MLAEAVRQSLRQSILLVYPDDESAQDAVCDFRTLSNGRVVHFPERAMAPHRFELRENLAAGGDRNESLLTILNGGADVVVTSVLGLVEKTITRASLSAHQRVLAVGDTIDLDALREHLVDMGYDAAVGGGRSGAVRGARVDRRRVRPGLGLPGAHRARRRRNRLHSLASISTRNARLKHCRPAPFCLPRSVPLDDEAARTCANS